MTKQLIILGESLVDSGNTAALAAIIGQNPFEDKRYNQGGNIRASDGPVLGEFIALEMGAKIENAQLISVLSSDEAKAVQVHNYAHAGARTDGSPGFSLPLVGQLIGIGLEEQKNALLKRKSFYKNQSDVDVLVSCGGNDLRDVLDEVDQIKDVISTDTKRDDKRFANSIAKPIAKNLVKTINKVDRLTDEIALIGSLPISQTPETQDWLINFSNTNQDDLLDVINLVSKVFTQVLNKKYKNINDVAVLMGLKYGIN